MASVRNLKLILSYVGTHYMGWQKTPLGPSIEQSLSCALQTILQQTVLLQAASRTDAGVHAEGQVVNFFTDNSISLSQLLRSLNGMLSKDIRIQSVEEMPLNFHPTTHCIQKEYHYTLNTQRIPSPFHRKTSWHFPYPLDLALMTQAIPYLIGSHDFSAFCNARALWTRDSICSLKTITIETPFDTHLNLETAIGDGKLTQSFEPEPLPIGGPFTVRECAPPIEKGSDSKPCITLPSTTAVFGLKFILTGDHFLYKMVRNLVGTLVYIGCCKISLEELPSILKNKDRRQAGITAPAHGLCLKRICYKPEVPVTVYTARS